MSLESPVSLRAAAVDVVAAYEGMDWSQPGDQLHYAVGALREALVEAQTSGLRQELEHLLNRHSRENRSGTPDFILAHYLERTLTALEETVKERDKWWGWSPMIGGTIPAVSDGL